VFFAGVFIYTNHLTKEKQAAAQAALTSGTFNVVIDGEKIVSIERLETIFKEIDDKQISDFNIDVEVRTLNKQL